MIFVTLGSQKFQFNRLLSEIDELIKQKVIIDTVFAQIGYSDYKPQNYRYDNFLNRDDYNNKMLESDIVITHGGTGAIIGAVKKKKKVIAVPRLKKFGEHVDDHQIQLLKQFDGMNLLFACYELNNLGNFLSTINNTSFNEYISNTITIIDSIESYLLSN